MNKVVVYGSTGAFLVAELVGFLSGLSIEQALIRSLLLYGVLFVAGLAIVRIFEQAKPVEESISVSEATGSTIDVTTPDMPVASADNPAASLVAETVEKEQVHQEVEAAFKQKPKEMAQIISSVMKNE